MPKLYEYFGLVVLFYSNEHEPVHVHGAYQGRECRAVIILAKGRVVRIEYGNVKGRRPLGPRQLADFKRVVDSRKDDIVKKWINFFVLNKTVSPETITTRLP